MAKLSKAMLQAKRFLEKEGFRFLMEDGPVLRGLMGGENTQWQWIIREIGDPALLLFYGYCPVKVPEARRPAVAEFLVRANWGVFFGNFEMDWSDGEVLYRTTIPVATSGLSAGAMSHLVYAPCANIDRYMPGLLAVAMGNEDPKQAADRADGKASPPTGDDAVSPTDSTKPPDAPDAERDDRSTEQHGRSNPPQLRRLFPNDN